MCSEKMFFRAPSLPGKAGRGKFINDAAANLPLPESGLFAYTPPCATCNERAKNTSMRMAMIHVRKVIVGVRHRRMFVRMGVRLIPIP